MGCGCCNKTAIFVINFIVCAVGFIIVVLGPLVLSRQSSYGVLLQSRDIFLPTTVLIAGLIGFFMGFLGCYGALKENSRMLQTYAIVVLIILIIEIVLSLMLVIYAGQTTETDRIVENMEQMFGDYGNGDKSLKASIDNAQHDPQCCGIYQYTDWTTFKYGIENPNSVADGCCKVMAEGCGKGVIVSNNTKDVEDLIFTRGCYDAMLEDIQNIANVLGVVSFSLSMAQLLSIFCACGVARKFSRNADDLQSPILT